MAGVGRWRVGSYARRLAMGEKKGASAGGEEGIKCRAHELEGTEGDSPEQSMESGSRRGEPATGAHGGAAGATWQ